MSEYKVSDYGIFTDAVKTTDTLNNDLDNIKKNISDSIKVLSDETVFMGPAKESVVELLNSVNTDIDSLCDDFNSINKYIIESSDAYKNGDKNASKVILDLNPLPQKREKVEETPKEQNKNSNNHSSNNRGSNRESSNYGNFYSAGAAAVTIPSTYTAGKNVFVGELSMDNYPTGSSREEGIQRAVLVAKYLIKNGGFTPEQAAALVGVYLDENNCDPGEVMQAEKDGYGVAGTGGNGYGAGIASWTFEESKRQCLLDAGFDPNTPIEYLTMQQQCDMIIAESQKSGKYYFDALRRCESLEDASATAVVMIGAPGMSSNWATHPTPAEAKAVSDFYGVSNDRNFGASEYHWNLDVRRLDYAREVYNLL